MGHFSSLLAAIAPGPSGKTVCTKAAMIARLVGAVGLVLGGMASIANAAPIAPTPIVGNVTLGAPDSNNKVLGSVDFGFAFDTSGITKNEWDRLAYFIQITLSPGSLEPGEGVWFFGLAENLVFFDSNLNADGITFEHYAHFPPFNPLQLSVVSGVQDFMITPLELYTGGSAPPYGTPGPAVDIVGFAVSIVDRNPNAVPEPSTLGLIGLGLLGLSAMRRRRRVTSLS